ncbi:hypothetical protein C7S20_09095 [Christiangramia fulva]|uniref:DUF4625 domain-containing protein n=1 Tax=Christiangramia fulva TaxID=2126553 RepID=A0A2R3Z5B6_9FLAO|nr:hypothetical protein [Christiangramia fulva]AVR45414.1 hypothetical protein C7S20_09095 [Christiangramia fulva]
MKYALKAALLLFLTINLSSCEKDEGIPPELNFKTGAGYTSSDATLASGTVLKVGIEADRTEDKDNLKVFNVSKSIDGGTPETVLNKSLTDDQGVHFEYDFTETLEGESGQVNVYTFTITNRDGITNQLELEITIE